MKDRLSMRPLVIGLLCLLAPALARSAANAIPKWCQALPRPEYRHLERVAVTDPWFEVYRLVPGVLAIYEPHQSEETIGYLILGERSALLFDTGMGIGDLRATIRELTALPVVVLNSHTHNDHVGDNWQFDAVYSLDTQFSRDNAQGSREAAQAEIAPGEICGTLPATFHPREYVTRPWKIAGWIHDGQRFDLGKRTIEVIATPGHTPDAISLLDAENGLLFTGDTYYPAPIWLYRPETDLAAYEQSVHRLAALAPHLKWVLGAHNVPLASPAVLPRLVAAFGKVRRHEVKPRPEGNGKVVYKVGDISFLMSAGD